MSGSKKVGALALALLACAAVIPAAAQGGRAAEPLLSVTDPAGDALGDGSATLPTQPAIRPEALDLRSFEVWPRGNSLSFRVGFAALDNPWNAPSGFSAQTLDIFVGTRTGGETRLADLNLLADGGSGWQYHLRVTGFGSQWQTALDRAAEVPDAGEEEAPAGPPLPAPAQVTVENGNTLVIRTDLPRGRYQYWVTSSVYSPFSSGGVLLPGGSGPFAVTSPAGDSVIPVPLDVLAEEASPQPFNIGALAPVGKLSDFRPWLLWGLGLLGLGLGLLASLLLWRTPRETVVVPPKEGPSQSQVR